MLEVLLAEVLDHAGIPDQVAFLDGSRRKRFEEFRFHDEGEIIGIAEALHKVAPLGRRKWSGGSFCRCYGDVFPEDLVLRQSACVFS